MASKDERELSFLQGDVEQLESLLAKHYETGERLLRRLADKLSQIDRLMTRMRMEEIKNGDSIQRPENQSNDEKA